MLKSIVNEGECPSTFYYGKDFSNLHLKKKEFYSEHCAMLSFPVCIHQCALLFGGGGEQKVAVS